MNIPQVSISDTVMSSCINGSMVLLEGGFPEGGQYSGQGVSEGYFYPGIAGLGNHNITYFFSGENNCSSAATTVMEVNNAPTVYTLTGQASYCQGYGGTTLLLTGSDTGTMYQLFRNDSVMGGFLPGSGDTLLWQNLTYGIYRVDGISNNNGCLSQMAGIVSVSENVLPQTFTVEGIPHYCHETTGSKVYLNGSQFGCFLSNCSRMETEEGNSNIGNRKYPGMEGHDARYLHIKAR